MLGGGRKQRAPQSLLLSVHLGVVTPCPSPLREGDVAQSRVKFPGRRPPAESWQPPLGSSELAAV